LIGAVPFSRVQGGVAATVTVCLEVVDLLESILPDALGQVRRASLRIVKQTLDVGLVVYVVGYPLAGQGIRLS
jgi:hypothetical protein